MNIQAIIGAVVAIVVLGGGAWYLSSTPPQVQEEGEEQTATGNTAEGTGTFAELMNRGGSWTCTISVTTPEAPSEGTTYISGSDIRSDVVTRPQALGGKEIKAHMILTEGYIYSWTDMFPQGFKMPVAEGASNAQSQGFDVNAAVSYSCAPWIADAGKFVVPTTVNFMEFNGEAVPQ
jgi:hypothetical protein